MKRLEGGFGARPRSLANSYLTEAGSELEGAPTPFVAEEEDERDDH